MVIYFIQARQEGEVEAMRRHVQAESWYQIHQLQDEVAITRRQLVVSNLPHVWLWQYLPQFFQKHVEELQAEVQAKNDLIAKKDGVSTTNY